MPYVRWAGISPQVRLAVSLGHGLLPSPAAWGAGHWPGLSGCISRHHFPALGHWCTSVPVHVVVQSPEACDALGSVCGCWAVSVPCAMQGLGDLGVPAGLFNPCDSKRLCLKHCSGTAASRLCRQSLPRWAGLSHHCRSATS